MPVRLDARSWLLIAVAAWAIGCAVVAVGGFGGNYQLLSDSPALAPALPALPRASTNAALGPLQQYAEVANHPLFYPDRKPVAAHIAGQKSREKQLDAILTSIIITPAVQMAIVQDNKTKQSLRVREGDALGGDFPNWTLVAMTPRSAVFDGGALGKTTLDLRVFNGQGGEPPTRMGLTPKAVASGAAATAANATVAHAAADASGQDTGGDAPDDSDEAANNAATSAATDAAQQAEQIRRRIEERRRQAQAPADNVPPQPDKDK